ncbi:hypothetical protein BSL78_17278, partial [Apostichopus japonicus]
MYSDRWSNKQGRQKTRQAQMMAISDLLEIPHSSGNYGTAALSAHPGMAMPVRQNVAKRSSSGATDAATRQSRERSTSSPMSSRRQPGSHRNQDERRHSA